MNNKKFYLYGLYCPIYNDLRYIGITTGSLKGRLNAHLKKPTNLYIKNWFEELQEKSLKPNILLIKECKTYDDLLQSEILEIKKCRESNYFLYNISDGGDINPMFGRHHTKESKEKISIIQKGRKRSSEEKEKQKERLKELWNDEQWANIVREKFLNRKKRFGFNHSKETKKKISESNKNREIKYYPRKNTFFHSDETKKLMSVLNSGKNNPMFGKKLPKETLLKRSEKIKKNGTYKGKNNPNYKFDFDKNIFIDLYINKKYSVKQISEYYGCSYQLIIKKIREFELSREHVRKKYFFNIEDIKEYLNKGMKQVEISKIYNCSPKIINKYIKKYLK